LCLCNYPNGADQIQVFYALNVFDRRQHSLLYRLLFLLLQWCRGGKQKSRHKIYTYFICICTHLCIHAGSNVNVNVLFPLRNERSGNKSVYCIFNIECIRAHWTQLFFLFSPSLSQHIAQQHCECNVQNFKIDSGTNKSTRHATTYSKIYRERELSGGREREQKEEIMFAGDEIENLGKWNKIKYFFYFIS
jgi:hypothetical protein